MKTQLQPETKRMPDSLLPPRRFGLQSFIVWNCALLLLFIAFVAASKLFAWGFPQRRAVNPLYAVFDPMAPNFFTLLAVAVFAVFFFLVWRFLADEARRPLSLTLLFFVLSSFAVNASVAMVRGGPAALESPFLRPQDYYAEIGKVEGLMAFLRDYPTILGTMETHGHVHPPGPVLLLWLISQLIGQGPFVAALVVVVTGSLSVAPVYLLLRGLYGEGSATAGAALYIVIPSVVLFTATSMNAVFSFLAAWLFLIGFKLIQTRRFPLAVGLGALLSLSTFFTFDHVFVAFFLGMAGLLFAIQKRDWRSLPVFALIPLVYTSLYLILHSVSGYNLIEVFTSTYGYYKQDRADMVGLYGPESVSALYWFFGNAAASLFFLGVPTAVLFFRGAINALKRAAADTTMRSIGLAALVTLAAVNLPGLYYGEVERIWMYLVPLAMVFAVRILPGFQQGARSTAGLYSILGTTAFQTLLLEHVLYTYW